MKNLIITIALCTAAVGCEPKISTIMDTPIPEEAMQELRGYIQRDVAGGFRPEDEIAANAVEILSEEYSPEVLTPHAVELTREVVTAQKRAQASWPQTTDCDRLDSVLAALERTGVVCRQDFSCCGTCGVGEIHDEMDVVANSGLQVRGYAFYHMQDTWSAIEGGGLYLNYGSSEDDEAAAVAIGMEIAAALREHGLQVDWDESWTSRIHVRLDWKRRR